MARELYPLALRVIAVVAVVVATACGDKPAPSAASATKASADPPQGAPLAGKPFYRVDAGPQSPCATGATCEAQLVLTALGDYHVNKDYPFKFVADPAAVALDGDGAFALSGEKRGTMTVKFKPTAAGVTKVIGTFKLSVCSETTCEIETPKLELAVPVS